MNSDIVPENLKARLGSTDEEWKVINPLLRKVILAKRAVEVDAEGSMMPRFGGRFWEMGDGLSEARRELQTAVESRETPADDLGRKLATYRSELAKARGQLRELQEELRELLTVEQEGVMVDLGYLE